MPDTQYITCAFLQEFNIGDELIDWPLHITIVPWFYTNNIAKFNVELSERIAGIKQISTIIKEERVWGENIVNVVERTDDLQELHLRILDLIKTSATLLINEQYTGNNYTPHITRQGSLAAKQGDKTSIKAVYVIQKDANKKIKTVIDKIVIT